jgi:hypothetical protein
MNILNLTGIREGGDEPADKPEIRIGTPAEPLYLSAERGFVKTGSAARTSTRDRLTYLDKKGLLGGPNADKDLLLPTGGRRERRALQRSRATGRRKATRRYLERQRAATFQANHLAQMVNLDKGLVPAENIRTRIRATQSISRAIKTIVDEDRKRFDREFNAWVRAGKPGKPPKRPLRHEEVRARLEEIALGAKTRVPKAAR